MHQLPFNPFTLVNQILWSFICTIPVSAILSSAMDKMYEHGRKKEPYEKTWLKYKILIGVVVFVEAFLMNMFHFVGY